MKLSLKKFSVLPRLSQRIQNAICITTAASTYPVCKSFNLLIIVSPDAGLEGTAQSTAPDCTNDLSSRHSGPLCEIPLSNPSPCTENIRDPVSSAVPPSPMRPSVKRRSSPGPGDDEQPRKKGKGKLDASDDALLEPLEPGTMDGAASRQLLGSSFAGSSQRPPSKDKASSLQSSQFKTTKVSGGRSDTRTSAEVRARAAPKVLAASSSTSTSSTSRPPPVRLAKATANHTRLNARPRQVTGSGTSSTSTHSRTIHDQNLVDANASSSTAPSVPAVAGRSGDILGDGLPQVPAGNEPRRLPPRSLSASVPAVVGAKASTLTRPGRKPLVDKLVCLVLFISHPSLHHVVISVSNTYIHGLSLWPYPDSSFA